MEKKDRTISNDIEVNIANVKKSLFNSDDIQYQTFTLNEKKAVCIFLETMVDSDKIERNLLKNVLTSGGIDLSKIITANNKEVVNLDDVIKGIIRGNAAVFLEGETVSRIFNTKKDIERSIEEPSNEKVVRGSHDGFTESLSSNIQLVRERIVNPNLIVNYFTVGEETNTKIAITYINNITNPTLVEKVTNRIKTISSDMVFSPGFVEELIEDHPLSPFPQFLNTERPDRVMANLMEGRIAIFSEGVPTALICPVSFFSFYQSPDDYNNRFIIGSFYRLIRFISFFIAIFIPSFYIAVVTFHFEVIPGELVIPVKNAVEGIPYPPIVEALIMELTIELIREAGLRLPTPIGQTIGIVGGLVIGDAVVQAGLVSNIMIIVVAITAIASFVVPSTEMNSTLRVLRFPFMLAAATFGFFGIIFCFVILLIHLCKLETFGTPYFAPFAPLQLGGVKDSVVRGPIWKMKTRPIAVLPRKIQQIRRAREWKEENEAN